MKRIMAIVFVLLVTISLISCAGSVQDNALSNEEGKTEEYGVFIAIGSHLVYDSVTRIVYLKHRTYGAHPTYCPYYASNGLPYRYNPDTNTLEEINKES